MFTVEEFRQFGFTPQKLFPRVSKSDITKAETKLGFPIPQLLGRLYLEISNGIDGFAYAISGLEGGCDPFCGTLVDAYMDFKRDGESEDKEWKTGLLPFCHWGCAKFSCVDCADSANPIFTYEDSGTWAEQYTLAEFFEMWLKGEIFFSEENVEIVTKKITNPFTGKKTTVSSRTRKKRPT
jgi:hypothetical protein